jgi:MarR family transcriptional regulator, temperature-dependent positive regulator of motility
VRRRHADSITWSAGRPSRCAERSRVTGGPTRSRPALRRLWSNGPVRDVQPQTGPEQLPAPQALLAAPGYVARRLHSPYTAAWVRHVDPVLTGPQFAVLTAVDAYPAVEQGSLARAVALDRSTMASIVRRLEERGLITREVPREDGRKRLLRLTDEGSATLQAAYRRARALDVLLIEGIAVEAQRDLLTRLNAIAERWEGLVED